MPKRKRSEEPEIDPESIPLPDEEVELMLNPPLPPSPPPPPSPPTPPVQAPCTEEMKKLMGFTNFDTTKGKQVPGNNKIGAVHVVKKRRYRQYMNRKGGFNRPLDKVA